MATRYLVKKMKTRPEMDAVMDVIWRANYDPYEPFAQLFFPVLGFTQSAWDAAVAESKSRFWTNHINDPTSTWYYVQEVASGKVVGCAEWEEHLENPFKNGSPTIQASWWPEGDHREFCELIIRQIYSPRSKWMQRPHMGRRCRTNPSLRLTSCSPQLDGSASFVPPPRHRLASDDRRYSACR